ncbi:unnamed protein product [Rotaria magnacalcarata]|uniref:Uncharacterized protein n=2 Tax=Rotaria magnacalcarata TaxID=392030 RepID=A0A816VWH5_9BILA|nr:unnamed protein product [Rotaria magnacalcarata]
MFKNTHDHAQHNITGRLPSPIRKSVEKYVKCNLTQGQIKTALSVDYPTASVPAHQILNSITYARRKNNPEIFSIYDFNQWCMNHKYDDKSLHSTFVPYYSINNIDDIFVFFTTKQLIQQIKYSSLLQVDATYKLTWNDLPLLVLGAPLSLFLVLISHIASFGAQMSYFSVLISHIAHFGAQLSLFLVLKSHVSTLVLICLFFGAQNTFFPFVPFILVKMPVIEYAAKIS